jgi:succinyl-diaminopimelate desuccinylase
MTGGEAANAVLGKLTVKLVRDDYLAIELGKAIRGKEDQLTLETDLYGMTLTANGVSKHAATPEGAVSGTYLATTALLACPHLSANDRAICQFLQQATSGFYAEQWGLGSTDKYYGKLTFVNSLLSVDEKGRQTATFALRFGTGSDVDATVEASRKLFEENGWEITSVRTNKGFDFAEDHPMVVMAKEVYNEISGQNAATVQGVGGTYARKLKNAFGVGSFVPYLPKSYELPAGHGASHASDESIRIAALLETIKILIMYVVEGSTKLDA